MPYNLVHSAHSEVTYNPRDGTLEVVTSHTVQGVVRRVLQQLSHKLVLLLFFFPSPLLILRLCEKRGEEGGSMFVQAREVRRAMTSQQDRGSKTQG